MGMNMRIKQRSSFERTGQAFTLVYALPVHEHTMNITFRVTQRLSLISQNLEHFHFNIGCDPIRIVVEPAVIE